MLKKSRESPFILLIIGFILLQTCFSQIPTEIGTNPSAPCTDSSKTRVKLSIAPAVETEGTTYGCIPKTNLVANCAFYDLEDDSLCYCPNSLRPVFIGDTHFQKGCVPADEYKVNALCKYNTTKKTFKCKCPSMFNKVVPISTTSNNPNQVTHACTDTLVPNCQNYQIYENPQSPSVDLNGDSLPEGYNIVCQICLVGFTVFSGLAMQGFCFCFNPRDDVVIQSAGCPKDGTVDTDSCYKIELSSNKKKYVCLCDDSPQTSIQYVTSSSQSFEIGCLSNDYVVTGCKKYIYNTDESQITCDSCQNQAYKQVIVMGTDGGSTYRLCSSAKLIKGCKTYFSPSVSAATPPTASTPLTSCVECQDTTNWDLIPTTPLSGPGSVTPGGVAAATGFCAAKNRWVTWPGCSFYDAIRNKCESINSLFCKKCLSPSDGTVNPCGKASSQAGTCSDGSIAVQVLTLGGNKKTVCAKDGLIDRCKTYASKSGSTEPFTMTGGCRKCDSGYELVQTTYSNFDPVKKPCILSTKKITNCKVYNHDDFSCSICENGLMFDKTLNKCPKFGDVSAQCAKTLNIAGLNICVSCKKGFIMAGGNCLKFSD